MANKVYVSVLALWEADGRLFPKEFTWEDGRVFVIDRVLDARARVSLKAGDGGVRYTCRVQGKEMHLFFDDYEFRWFVEGK